MVAKSKWPKNFKCVICNLLLVFCWPSSLFLLTYFFVLIFLNNEEIEFFFFFFKFLLMSLETKRCYLMFFFFGPVYLLHSNFFPYLNPILQILLLFVEVFFKKKKKNSNGWVLNYNVIWVVVNFFVNFDGLCFNYTFYWCQAN